MRQERPVEKKYVLAYVPILICRCPGGGYSCLSMTFDQADIVSTDDKKDIPQARLTGWHKIICLQCRREEHPSHFVVYQRVDRNAEGIRTYTLETQYNAKLPCPRGWRIAGEFRAKWEAPGTPPPPPTVDNPSPFRAS